MIYGEIFRYDEIRVSLSSSERNGLPDFLSLGKGALRFNVDLRCKYKILNV